MIITHWYLLLLAVFLILPLFVKKNRLIANTAFTGTRPRGIRAYFYKVLQVSWLLYLLLLVFFIARPKIPDLSQKHFVKGIDIVLTMDISQSMIAEDFKPNRLEAAKQVMQKFIKARPNDRISVVVFSGEAYTLVPLSLDHDFLSEKINSIKANDGSIKQGTAIGVAIATASARLKGSDSKSKIIILLTDGENNSGDIDPLTASDIAKNLDQKIYTIGIGKDGRVPYPVTVNGFFGGKHKTYQYAMNHLDTRLLSGIAQKTGAKFFRATNNKALSSIFKEIDNLEQEKFLKNQKQAFKDLFPKYAEIIFLLGVILVFLSTVVLRKYP